MSRLMRFGIPFFVKSDSLYLKQIWGIGDGKPHPVELRRRVVDFVDEGHSHRAAARHFRVSPRFVNDLIVLRREPGSLEPKRQGNRGRNGKYQGVEVWLRSRVSECGELTLDELRVELERECGITVHRATVCDWLHRFGLSHKKCMARPRSASGFGMMD